MEQASLPWNVTLIISVVRFRSTVAAAHQISVDTWAVLSGSGSYQALDNSLKMQVNTLGLYRNNEISRLEVIRAITQVGPTRPSVGYRYCVLGL